jgi:hypothetical protein
MILRAARRLPLLAFVLLLAGCASPETRLRRALVETGLSEPLAACMAGRMADRLSLAQLYRMRDLGEAGRSESLDQLLHRVRSLGDSEILSVTAGSAAVCATGLAG